MENSKQEIINKIQELHNASLHDLNIKEAEKAIDKQKRILELLELLNDQNTEIIVRYNIGSFYCLLELHEEAIKEFEISYRIAYNKSNKRGIFEALIKISSIKSLWGQHEKAKEDLLYLLNNIVGTEDHQFTCEINFHLANIYRKTGNYTESHKKYVIAKNIAERENFINLKYRIINNMGYLFYEWKEYDTALLYYEEALEFEKREINLERIAMLYNNIGLVYQAKKDYTKSIEFFRSSLSLLDEVGYYERYKASTLNNQGLSFLELKLYDKAIEKFNLALSIHQKTKNISGERIVLQNIGDLYFKQRKLNEAEEYFQKAFDKGKNYNDIKKAHNLSSLGLVFLEKNQILKAKDFLIQSFHLRDQIMSAAPNESIRIEVRDTLFKILPILVEIFLRENNLFAALGYIEYSKGRELSLLAFNSKDHYIPEIRNILNKKNSNFTEIQTNNRNLKDLEAKVKYKFISEENYIQRRNELEKQIEDLQKRNKQLDTKLWEKYPEYGVAFPSKPIEFLNQFLGSIPEKTIILDFFYDVYLNRILVFVISRNKEISLYQKLLSTGKIDELKEITENIRLAQRERYPIKISINADQLSDFGIKLFKYLIPKELNDNINQNEPEFVVVIPNSFLHSLPLELIHDGEDYWGLKYNISRAYNISNFTEFHLDSSFSAILIGNPDSSLEHAKEEVLEINKLLTENCFETKTFIEKEAILSKIIQDFKKQKYALFHFSGHAEFNNTFPNLSCLYILDDNLNTIPLYGNEIPLNFHFGKPTLVVLNACETGTMSVSIGDEINGLSRGFIHAGANGIIFNIWSVFDASSAELLKEFYRMLLEGNNIAYSIRMARKYMREKIMNSTHESDATDILHWGSCIYYGNPTTKIIKESVNR